LRFRQDRALQWRVVKRRGLSLILPIAVVLAVTVAVAPVAAATSGAGTATRPDKVLSNETTSTTWTIADDFVPIRSAPAANSRAITKLREYTADGDLQSYILLRERWTSTGPWVDLRIPGRPNGRTGWVPRSVLDTFEVTHIEIVVNRESRTLTLYNHGHVMYRFPVGVGKPSTPTPAGHFWITEAGNFLADPFYGPYAFATSDFSTLSEWPGGGVVGIHGTNEPQLIPGDPSHGCIRLLNPDILRLAAIVHVGTPVLVR
jgi:lipoprotein-anchoring transpeptidase ErfK/SrfK